MSVYKMTRPKTIDHSEVVKRLVDTPEKEFLYKIETLELKIKDLLKNKNNIPLISLLGILQHMLQNTEEQLRLYATNNLNSSAKYYHDGSGRTVYSETIVFLRTQIELVIKKIL